MDYITVEQLAESLSQGQMSPVTDDLRAAAKTVVESASAQVDDYCGRRFVPTTTGVRRFTPDGSIVFELPRYADLQSVTSIEVDSDLDGVLDETWTTADVLLEPFDAPDRGVPYTRLSTVGDKRFPIVRGGLQITGTWGWGDTVPSQVVSATLILAAKLWSRRRSPDGVVATGAAGDIYRVSRYADPDVCSLLDGLARGRRVLASLQIGTR